MTRSRRFFASSPWIATGTPDYVNLGYTSRGLAKQALMRLSRKSLAIFRKLGLAPARLRRVTELVHTKIEEELSLHEMAQCAGLSTSHFLETFRRSTGESPHQFVLRQRVERAKEMLREAEMRVLDVAVACGFKTQQHFARVFRRICGASGRRIHLAMILALC